MDASALVNRYPKLYHMAEAGSWPSIRSVGLLSTSAIVDHFSIFDERRRALESRHRPEKVTLSAAGSGSIAVRD
jgi:hypothetical protein